MHRQHPVLERAFDHSVLVGAPLVDIATHARATHEFRRHFVIVDILRCVSQDLTHRDKAKKRIKKMEEGINIVTHDDDARREGWGGNQHVRPKHKAYGKKEKSKSMKNENMREGEGCPIWAKRNAYQAAQQARMRSTRPSPRLVP
jgi:hypothetical protein